MAQYMEQHSSSEDTNKQSQELLPTRSVIQSNETIIIDDDEDDTADVSCPDVSASVSKPPDHIKLEHIKLAEEPSGKADQEVTNKDHNVPSKLTDKVVKRRRPKPPDLPKKRQHKIIRIPLPKSSISHATVKSFKPTISLQKLFAGTSPRLVVKDNELQPAMALTEQYSTLPRQHPVHNWTIGIKRHKFRIYTK